MCSRFEAKLKVGQLCLGQQAEQKFGYKLRATVPVEKLHVEQPVLLHIISVSILVVIMVT